MAGRSIEQPAVSWLTTVVQAKSWQRELLVFLVLALFTLLVRLPSLHQPLENDSSALAYHARLIVQGEPLYSTHHTGHHLPGAYYVYAAAFALFGDDVASVKGVLILWTAVTVFLVYKLGSLVAGRRVGFVAACLATLLYGQIILAGTTSRIETFLGLPQLLAVYALLLFTGRAQPRYLLLTGVGLGLTFLFKANNIIGPAGLVALVLLARWWPQRRSGRGWWLLVQRAGWVAAGVAVVLLPIVLYFVSQGLWGRFLAVFQIGLNYTQVSPPQDMQPFSSILYPLLLLTVGNAAILTAALSALVVLALQWVRAGRQQEPFKAIYLIALWILLVFVETGISRIVLNHYYLVFIPPLTILAAWFLEHFIALLPRPVLRWVAGLVVLVLVLLALGTQQHRYYYEYGRFVAGWQTHGEFLVNGLPDNAGATMHYLAEIADYVQQHSTEADTLYNWSNLMELNYLAGRRSPVPIIWPVYAGVLSERDDIFNATYFIVGDLPLGYEAHPDWLKAGLDAHYMLETTLHTLQIYRHK